MIAQPTTRPATPADALRFLSAMNDAEFENMRRALSNPLAALQLTICRSIHTYYAVASEGPLFLGGLLPGGAVWMMSTPHADRYRKFTLRETRRQVGLMLALCHRLHARVGIQNPMSLRWLQWLGFTLGDVEDMGGVPVLNVEMFRDE